MERGEGSRDGVQDSALQSSGVKLALFALVCCDTSKQHCLYAQIPPFVVLSFAFKTLKFVLVGVLHTLAVCTTMNPAADNSNKHQYPVRRPVPAIHSNSSMGQYCPCSSLTKYAILLGISNSVDKIHS
eukprot:3530278-Rhodomonas_salina.3